MNERSLAAEKLAPLISKLLAIAGFSNRQTLSFRFEEKNGEVHWTAYAGRRNLFQPKGDDFVYLALRASLLRALHENGTLLWAAIASAETDSSGHFGTEFFAIGQNGLVLRCAPPDIEFVIAVVQAILADSLQLILDEISDLLKDRRVSGAELYREVSPVLQKYRTLPIEGSGKRAFHAFSAWTDKKTIRVFENILSEEALHHLYERKVKEYVQAVEKELERKFLSQEIQKLQEQTAGLGWEAKGRVFCELIAPKMEKL